MKILVINGPNINMLGIREPGIYGTQNFNDLLALLDKTATEFGITVEQYQSNHEGDLVDRIQAAYGNTDGIVINPAAYTHTSVAISAAEQYLAENADAAKRIVIASTASPYKFASAVYESLADKTAPEGPAALDALTELTGVEITAPLAGLDKKTVRFTRVIESTDMPSVTLENTK